MEGFAEEVKKRFDEIEKKERELINQLDELKVSKKPLRAYLIEAGLVEKKTRAKRTRLDANKG